MRLIVLCLVAFSVWSCSVEPAPLVYGKDFCHTCKMTLMDKKFGAEVVTSKGKVYKFDDLNCMINFLNSGFLDDQVIAYELVIDFANPEKLINAKDAHYVKSGEIRSPMASEIAAFADRNKLDTSNKEWNGILLSWGEVLTEFK